MDRRDRDNRNAPRGGPGRQGPSRGATNPQPRRQAQPRAPQLASYEDPNAYRSPGFQDQLHSPYAIDYAGLPRDDEDPDAPAPQSAPKGFRNTVFQNPRGMGGRRPDRTGTDPNA
jgi:hypothetical protein